MIQHLRKHLIIIYTMTAGGILTAVFIVMAIFMNYQETRKRNELFQNNMVTVQSKLQSDNTISDQWLSNFEKNNHLILYIIDNGKSLFFSGMLVTETPRYILINTLLELAANDGVSVYSKPINQDIIQSSIYTIHGNHSDLYHGATMTISKKDGYRSFVILQPFTIFSAEFIRQLIFIIVLNFIVVFSLYLLIRKLVDRSLQPVKDSQERQTQFIASASHELRSPLAVIRANNSLDKKDDNSYAVCEHIIEDECNRMARLINDMLLLASGDANSWTLEKEDVNIDTLLLKAYESTIARAREKKIRIDLRLPDYTLPSLQGDPDRILQVLVILLDNAICYSSPDSHIELAAYTNKKDLCILVIDHGIGISTEDKLHIFDRFYRVDQSRKDKSHFGLGLSIAQELVALHHGTINVNDTPGGGTTFTMIFPR